MSAEVHLDYESSIVGREPSRILHEGQEMHGYGGLFIGKAYPHVKVVALGEGQGFKVRLFTGESESMYMYPGEGVYELERPIHKHKNPQRFYLVPK